MSSDGEHRLIAERRRKLEALREEREAILNRVADERAALIQGLAGVVAGALKESRTEIVDHLVWRVVQILAVVLPLCFLGAWFLIWYAKRR